MLHNHAHLRSQRQHKRVVACSPADILANQLQHTPIAN